MRERDIERVSGGDPSENRGLTPDDKGKYEMEAEADNTWVYGREKASN